LERSEIGRRKIVIGRIQSDALALATLEGALRESSELRAGFSIEMKAIAEGVRMGFPH
jgi:hypothetical protein